MGGDEMGRVTRLGRCAFVRVGTDRKGKGREGKGTKEKEEAEEAGNRKDCEACVCVG
jgi:hypothetical protein